MLEILCSVNSHLYLLTSESITGSIILWRISRLGPLWLIYMLCFCIVHFGAWFVMYDFGFSSFWWHQLALRSPAFLKSYFVHMLPKWLNLVTFQGRTFAILAEEASVYMVYEESFSVFGAVKIYNPSQIVISTFYSRSFAVVSRYSTFSHFSNIFGVVELFLFSFDTIDWIVSCTFFWTQYSVSQAHRALLWYIEKFSVLSQLFTDVLLTSADSLVVLVY